LRPTRDIKLGIILVAPLLNGRHRWGKWTVSVPGVSPRLPPLIGLIATPIQRHLTELVSAIIEPEILHVQVLLMRVLQRRRDHVGDCREELLGLLSEHVLHLVLLHHIRVAHHHRVHHIWVAHHCDRWV
jgi:hypothetical protein